jgi:hypothetical protein
LAEDLPLELGASLAFLNSSLLLVGAPGYRSNAEGGLWSEGEVWSFAWDEAGDQWVAQRVVYSPLPSARFGAAIGVGGGTTWVGAPTSRGAADQGSRTGSIWSVDWNSGTLLDSIDLSLTGEDTEFFSRIEFGASVSVSADGHTLVVGAPRDRGEIGVTRIFVQNATTHDWEFVNFVYDDSTEFAHAGKSLAVSGDGTKFVVGAPDDCSKRGKVWIVGTEG